MQKIWNLSTLDVNVFVLGLNFNKVDEKTRVPYKTIDIPKIEEIIEFKKTYNAIHPVVEQLMNGDAVMRLYAAICLLPIEEEKSNEILHKLTDDDTEIKVQHPIGHGFIEVPIKYPARSFLEHSDILIGVAGKKRELGKLLAAAYFESKDKSIDLEGSYFPSAEAIANALEENPAELEKIKNALIEMAGDELVSKRFYAAVALRDVDNELSGKILISLLEEETEILSIEGDLGNRTPAKYIARSMLGIESEVEEYNSSKSSFLSSLFSLFRR